MSLALYRKYRPATFDDVVGQQVIVDTLKRQVATGRIAHAYLFTGSRGTGKTSCAKILAKAVNCLNPTEGNPCGVCTCCRGVEDGSLTDVAEIDAASNNGVDSIRDLREEAFYTPAIARYRVYIIDEVHMLSQSAFNALLKIMEEPPEHVIFILSTTEIHKVLPTIISRCQRYDFARIENDVIAARLRYIAGEEGIDLTEDGAMQIARLSDGALRDALSLLDVCRADGKTVDAEAVAAAAGLTGESHLFELAGYLLEKKVAEAIGLVEELSRRSLEPLRLCEQLMGHLRSLMIAKTVAEPLPLIGCMPDQLARYREQAGKASLGDIMACLSELGTAATAIGRTTAKRIELELAIVKICTLPASESGQNELLGRLQKVERMVASSIALQQTTPAAKPPERQPEPVIAPPPEPALLPPQPVETQPPANEGAPPWDNGEPAEAAPEPPPLFAPEPVQPAPEQPPLFTPEPAGPSGEDDTDDPVPDASGLVPFEAWDQVLLRLESINRMNAGLLRGSRAYLSGRRVLIDCKDPVFLDMMRTKEETRTHIKKAIYLTTGQQFGIGPYKQASESAPMDPLEAFIKGLPLDDDTIIIK